MAGKRVHHEGGRTRTAGLGRRSLPPSRQEDGAWDQTVSGRGGEREWIPDRLQRYTCARSLQSCPLFTTLFTVAHQVPLSMEFSRQQYWSGLPCPTSGDFLDSGIEQYLFYLRQSLPSEPSGSPQGNYTPIKEKSVGQPRLSLKSRTDSVFSLFIRMDLKPRNISC